MFFPCTFIRICVKIKDSLRAACPSTKPAPARAGRRKKIAAHNQCQYKGELGINAKPDVIVKRKNLADLSIIVLTTLIVLGGYLIARRFMGSSGGSTVSGMSGSGVTDTALLLQTFIGAFTQFGLLGLGITIVCLLRKESFISFGLTAKRFLPAAVFSALACLPSLLYTGFISGIHSYLPFQGVSFTKPLLGAGFPVNALGLALVILAWGFFEGFTYVVLNDRINRLLPSKHLFLNWGAVICGICCLLLHTALGLPPESVLSGLCDFLIIYGMLVAKDYTGNAWGCILVYVFFWNAIA